LVEQLKGPARTKRKEEGRNETKDDVSCDKTGELLIGDYILDTNKNRLHGIN
jgi:hypothetical protein